MGEPQMQIVLCSDVAESEGFDLRCGAGRVAALTCHWHVIHYRSRSNPDPAMKILPCQMAGEYLHG